ncbi:hypothetical protein BKI52_17900 [marine bacterium AO1-C]|nr:hypothetical protein BKI52_17900 [marine bacterium AO1-C]
MTQKQAHSILKQYPNLPTQLLAYKHQMVQLFSKGEVHGCLEVTQEGIIVVTTLPFSVRMSAIENPNEEVFVCLKPNFYIQTTWKEIATKEVFKIEP